MSLLRVNLQPLKQQRTNSRLINIQGDLLARDYEDSTLPIVGHSREDQGALQKRL
jgi:hypothetical protein